MNRKDNIEYALDSITKDQDKYREAFMMGNHPQDTAEVLQAQLEINSRLTYIIGALICEFYDHRDGQNRGG